MKTYQAEIKREHLDTNEAAVLLGRAPNTLRKWACLETGPIRPIRINGRLAWSIADIQVLLNGGVSVNKGDKSLRGEPRPRSNSWGNFKHASWANHPEIV